ncbi:MAG: GAF domain-containing sensor histidine kinase [Elusimicrobiota bacterium]
MRQKIKKLRISPLYIFLLALLFSAVFVMIFGLHLIPYSLFFTLAVFLLILDKIHRDKLKLTGWNAVYRKAFFSITDTSVSLYKVKNQVGSIFEALNTLQGIFSCRLIMKDDDGILRCRVFRGEGKKDKIPDYNPSFLSPEKAFVVKEPAGKDSRSGASLYFPLFEGRDLYGFAGFTGKNEKVFMKNGMDNFKMISFLIDWMYKNTYKVRELELQAQKVSREAESAGDKLSSTNARLIQRVKELKSLYNLSIGVYSSSDTAEAAELVFREMAHIMEIEDVVYFEFFGDRLRAAEFSSSKVEEKLGDFEMDSKALDYSRAGELSFSEAGKSLKRIFKSLESNSLLVVPALAADKLKGYLFCKKDEERIYSARERELLEMYASRLAEYIERDEILKKTLDDKCRLEELIKIKDNFLSLISHEFKTPLTSIKGFTQALVDQQAGELNSRQHDFLVTIEDSVRSLEDKINNIINFAGISAGKSKLKKKPENIVRIIKKCFEDYKQNFKKKNIKYIINTEGSIKPVNVDREKIEKAVKSLAGNALKFTPAGGYVRVSIYPRGDFVQVSVEDSGIGVSEKIKKKVFEKFFQHQPPKTRSFAGLGLGLSIAGIIIKKHGGEIEIDSRSEGGTEVSFILPLK